MIIRGLRFLFLFFFTILLLASCKSLKDRSSDEEIMAAETQGMEGQPDIQTIDNSHKYEAPFNQIYYFAFDNSSIKQEDIESVVIQAEYLAKNPQSRIYLAGHTDIRGSDVYNLALGERRARTVYDLLLLHGVKKDQIQMVSYGSEKPAVRGTTEEAYQWNRRVELTYKNE